MAGDADDVDTFNKFAVSVSGRGISILVPPHEMTPDDARLVAAWLVALAGGREKFLRVLDAVERT